MPHEKAPSKEPLARLEVLHNAGTLKIPMTTGLLVGIGETFEEIIDSIFDIHTEGFARLSSLYLRLNSDTLCCFIPGHVASNFLHALAAPCITAYFPISALSACVYFR